MLVDTYLRRSGHGPKAGARPTRDEIEAYLQERKDSGMMVSLSYARVFLEQIRAETSDLGCREDAERVYCWRRQERPPLCVCGQPRKFNCNRPACHAFNSGTVRS